MKTWSGKGEKGFTLLELMIAVSITLILTTITVYNLLGDLPKYRLKSTANKVARHLGTLWRYAVEEEFLPGSVRRIRPLRELATAQGPTCVVDGREVISFSSNDYLGLTHHPRLREAALAAVRDFGVGSGAVRTIAGTMTLHEQLERDLAAFKRVEATLVFQSGFTANTGVMPVVASIGEAAWAASLRVTQYSCQQPGSSGGFVQAGE